MQQVNLYQPILRKQEKVFSAKTLLQGNLLVLVGLLLLYGYTLLQTLQLEEQLDAAAAQRDERQQRLASLRRRYPEPVRDESVSQRIEQQRQLLQTRQALFGAVQRYDDAPEQRFSEHLAGLSRQDLPSLWLHHIIVRANRQLALEGSALAAKDVPLLLQRLGREPAFSGTAFHSVVIQRNEETRQIDFALHTHRPEPEGAAR